MLINGKETEHMAENCIVILCDQLRTDFLSCYNPDSPVLTPFIQQLADDGVLFNHSVTASPVCAPGRASMMTGRYVSDHRVWSNDTPFRDGIEFLPQRMKEQGYACGAFGKLHHFPEKDSKGFDYAWQMEERRLGEEDDYFQYLKSLHPEITDLTPIENRHFPYDPCQYYESQIASRAIDFIDKNKSLSFFTWISFQGPHGPMDPPNIEYTKQREIPTPINPEFTPPCQVVEYRRGRSPRINNVATSNYREDYCMMIEFIDNKIGEIINYLKRENLYDDTTIIFSTDHGDMCGDYSMYQKGPYLYKAQLEIPMIIANHKKLPKKTVSDMLTTNLDIGGTALAIKGETRPLGYSRDMGQMFLNSDKQRKQVYTEFCDSMKLISDKEYRFAYYPFTKEYELVKITDETCDLSQLPEYQSKVQGYLMDIIDFTVVGKQVQIEAQDMTPKVQKGLMEKFPNFMDEIPLFFPIASMGQINSLKSYGLDHTYNEFCKTRKISNFYGKYWEQQ